jgi:hypothetical protein
MRITDPTVRVAGFGNAALKLIALSPTLCVGYAEDSGMAVRAISAAAADPDPESVADALLRAHRQSVHRADFLIASLRPHRLVCIKDGRMVETQSAWLGSRSAFLDYEQHYLRDRLYEPPPWPESPGHAEDTEIASRMGDGMNAVVHGSPRSADGTEVVIPRGGDHAEVGEAVVSVAPRIEDGLFKYLEHTMARSSGLATPLPAGPGGVVPPDWGSAERGAVTARMLTPVNPGVAAIALYFDEGQVGFFYAPLLLDEPEKYARRSVEAFVECVRLRHGIELTGFLPLRPTLGGQP